MHTCSISDSEIWPTTSLAENEDYTVLNLPYQKVGIKDIRLYNLISDSTQEDEEGYITSQMEVRAPNYYNFYAQSEFNIKRIITNFTDITLVAPEQVEYSDYIEIYFIFT